LTGAAPPVLLLHGQPGSARDWHAVVAALGSRAQAIAIDRPGWDGRSRATDLDGNAAAAIAALDRLGVDRAIVAGHSLGAAVAAWVAVRHPERVAALALASPAANTAAVDHVDRVLAAPLAGPLLTVASMSGIGLTLSAAGCRSVIARRLGIDPAYLQEAARGLLTASAWRAFVTEQRSLLAGLPMLEAALSAITAPTVVIAGSADRIVPLTAARALAEQIGGAQLTIIDGARHLLPQRHAPKLVEAILAAPEIRR
jgi:pimeloyl-ACP methyl ester carboxylesterase